MNTGETCNIGSRRFQKRLLFSAFLEGRYAECARVDPRGMDLKELKLEPAARIRCMRYGFPDGYSGNTGSPEGLPTRRTQEWQLD
jgi:hypothetical protein